MNRIIQHLASSCPGERIDGKLLDNDKTIIQKKNQNEKKTKQEINKNTIKRRRRKNERTTKTTSYTYLLNIGITYSQKFRVHNISYIKFYKYHNGKIIRNNKNMKRLRIEKKKKEKNKN